jgi:hypothetical protein
VLYERRAALSLDIAWFPERPPEPPPRDLWDPAELHYEADFTAGAAGLTLRRHRGGDLDWYSVDATTPVAAQAPPPAPVSALAARITYPGAPHPRWWQIEELRTDLGAYSSDRSHFTTLLLLETIVSYGDDWFTFPIPGQAGHVVTVRDVTVRDSFEDVWQLQTPSDGWSLFAVAGLDAHSVVVWPTVATPLVGPILDQVDLGLDEDANVVWAVERRIGGRDLPSPEHPPASVPGGQADAATQPRYTYRASAHVPSFWHPYLIEGVGGRRRLVQGRLADLSGATAMLTPEPATDLLRDPASDGAHPVHQIEPSAIPTDGLQLERRYVLGRRTDGTPVLWVQRRRGPLTTVPVLTLQFDVLERA